MKAASSGPWFIRRSWAGRSPSSTNAAAAPPQVEAANLIGCSLQNKVAVIFDDMISTAKSLVSAVNVARFNGAREIYACATHAVLCDNAINRLSDARVTQIVVTDSIPLTPEKRTVEDPCAERRPAAGRRHQADSLQ